MNFAELLTEFYDSGFAYLDDGGAGAARAGRWVNQSYRELCAADRWPFLEASASGAGSVTIADLRFVESVVDEQTGVTLEQISRRTLTDRFGDLSAAGCPSWFYLAAGSTVSVFPVGGQLTVKYWRRPALLTGTDEPVVPEDYHDIINLGAVRRGCVDDSDAADYQQVSAEYTSRLAVMRGDLVQVPQRQVLSAFGSEDA